MVDCIVNASDHNRMIIQMSYNHQHHNHVLKEVMKIVMDLHFRYFKILFMRTGHANKK